MQRCVFSRRLYCLDQRVWVEKQFRVTALSCESARQHGVQHFPALSIRETTVVCRGVQQSVTGRIVVRSRLGEPRRDRCGIFGLCTCYSVRVL